MCDANGNCHSSVIALADCAGNRVAVNSYDDYGIPAAGNFTPSLRQRFQYTGQAWLPEIGMYYYKARIYSPTLGRFMQTDPVGYEDQINLYAYVGNDPLNRADPSGESWEDVADVVIGTAKVAVGAVGAVAGGAVVGASGVAEVGTVGVATPVAVPTAVAGVAIVAASGVVATDGAKQLVRGLKGIISENRGNRGGQGQGERGQTAKPSGTAKPDKHANPDKGYRTDPHTGKKIPLPPPPKEKPPEPERIPRGKKSKDDW